MYNLVDTLDTIKHTDFSVALNNNIASILITKNVYIE